MQILGEHESSVKKMLDEFGVYLKPSTFGKDVKPFLKDACSQIFGSATGLVDMMVAHVPSSKAGNATKVHPSPFAPPLSTCCQSPQVGSLLRYCVHVSALRHRLVLFNGKGLHKLVSKVNAALYFHAQTQSHIFS